MIAEWTGELDNSVSLRKGGPRHPAHALLIVEERLREQLAEGVQMPDGMPLDELALRVPVSAYESTGLRLPNPCWGTVRD
jgi:hypothetical protein